MGNRREAAPRSLEETYHAYTRRIVIINLILFLLILVSAFCSASYGVEETNFASVFRTILGRGTQREKLILFNIRLPRIASAAICGAGLALAGCVMQNVLKNPLASPSTLGITNGAAFGANLGILLLGAGSMQSSASDAVVIANPYIVTLCAFLSAVAAMLVILGLSRIRSFHTSVIVLAGVAVSSLFGAGTTFIQYFANETHIATATFWTFGNLGRASWNEIAIMAVVVFLSSLYFIRSRWDYNAMSAGELPAKSLGVNVERVRFLSMLLASVITAVCVSFLGIISFIGLISSQIMRRIVGNDHRYLLPASALMGSLLLIVSDTLSRIILSPTIVPVGIITSFFGAPLFLYILMRDYNNT